MIWMVKTGVDKNKINKTLNTYKIHCHCTLPQKINSTWHNISKTNVYYVDGFINVVKIRFFFKYYN